jgi:NAD(P)-dependent dehydrogenase (short-subunit alcohol dehydrogenase family)
MTTAIVTGGSRGFGLAVAGELVRAGWDVVIDARGAGDLEAAAAGLGPRAHAVPGDVRDGSHRAALVDTALSLGGLDLLVNNAGDLGPSPLPSVADVDPEALGALFDANVLAPLALLQVSLPHLVRANGAVVNVTSDAAVEGYEGWGAYGATKAALEQLSRVLAAEEPGLRVWWLDPGDMRTAMHQAAFPGEDISDRASPESVAPAVLGLFSKRPPSGRMRASELLEGLRS